MMIEVYKTNVVSMSAAAALTSALQEVCPACRITFDLEDRDRILRIKGDMVDSAKVQNVMARAGYSCCELEALDHQNADTLIN